eukprot:365788-Chlamydomonas_euryale.AAC.2
MVARLRAAHMPVLWRGGEGGGKEEAVLYGGCFWWVGVSARGVQRECGRPVTRRPPELYCAQCLGLCFATRRASWAVSCATRYMLNATRYTLHATCSTAGWAGRVWLLDARALVMLAADDAAEL